MKRKYSEHSHFVPFLRTILTLHLELKTLAWNIWGGRMDEWLSVWSPALDFSKEPNEKAL